MSESSERIRSAAARSKQETLYLSARCIRVHDDVVINIGHQTGSAVKVSRAIGGLLLTLGLTLIAGSQDKS